jgi:hypothetical protein
MVIHNSKSGFPKESEMFTIWRDSKLGLKRVGKGEY